MLQHLAFQDGFPAALSTFEIPTHVPRELGGYTVPVFLHCLAGLSSCLVRLKMMMFAVDLLFWGSMGLQRCQGAVHAAHVLVLFFPMLSTAVHRTLLAGHCFSEVWSPLPPLSFLRLVAVASEQSCSVRVGTWVLLSRAGFTPIGSHFSV